MRTIVKSKNISEKIKSGNLDRPFASGVLRRAKEIADQYQIIVWSEDGGFYGRGMELPGVMADGPTAGKCVEAVREALVGGVAHLIETGQPVPAPASGAKRTEQINIRLTTEEKTLLEAAAQGQGYRGISDYVRATVIGRVEQIGHFKD